MLKVRKNALCSSLALADSCVAAEDDIEEPAQKRARMVHWSQQDGPLNQGFARQRQMAESRPARPPQIVEQPEPTSAAPQWLTDIKAGRSAVRHTEPRIRHNAGMPSSESYAYLMHRERPPPTRALVEQPHLMDHPSSVSAYHQEYSPSRPARSGGRVEHAIEARVSQPAHYGNHDRDVMEEQAMQSQYDSPTPRSSHKRSKRRTGPRREHRASSEEYDNFERGAPKGIQNDIDSCGLREEDRKRKRRDDKAYQEQWSTLSYIQHLKDTKGARNSSIVATDPDHIPNAYKSFEPVWKPKPSNKIATEAKFSLPMRRLANRNVRPVAKDDKPAVIHSESKRSVFKPDRTVHPDAKLQMGTVKKPKGKAAKVRASLRDNSVMDDINAVQAPKIEVAVPVSHMSLGELSEARYRLTFGIQPTKPVLYRASRFLPEGEEGYSSATDLAAHPSSESDKPPVHRSSPPTTPASDGRYKQFSGMSERYDEPIPAVSHTRLKQSDTAYYEHNKPAEEEEHAVADSQGGHRSNRSHVEQSRQVQYGKVSYGNPYTRKYGQTREIGRPQYQAYHAEGDREEESTEHEVRYRDYAYQGRDAEGRESYHVNMRAYDQANEPDESDMQEQAVASVLRQLKRGLLSSLWGKST